MTCNPIQHYDVYKLATEALKSKDIQITLLPAKPIVPFSDWHPPPSPLNPSWERLRRHTNDNIERSKSACTWILRGGTETEVEEGFAIVKEVVKRVYHKWWEGRLTFPDDSLFGRIIGTDGGNLKRLQDDTGTNITVPKSGDGTTIVIIG